VPVPGEKVTLSIDAEVTEALYRAIEARAKNSGFRGGAGVIMDIHTGELLALTSYPEYSPSVLLGGNKDALAALLGDTRQPFLDRAVSGLYAPGSIVKPMVALAALTEGVIDEHTQILSTGQISIPNPYDPSKPTIFRDWRAHGFTDMREAIAVSSDVYFYAVGGGYKNQIGLGIQRLDTYLRMFGFGSPTGLEGVEEPAGTIPTPAWKEKNFPGDPWRIGNTYHTAIGQYGVQVTPLQAARATAALANGGLLLTPSLVASSSPKVADTLNFSEQDLRVVREGMRMSVTQGIAAAVNLPYVEVAAKTGTAQLGANNEYINSWVIGFFPYKNPKYAFAVVLEKAPASTNVGAVVAMHAFFQWMQANAPQYLK
jgi:penicillin-binding protein 2